MAAWWREMLIAKARLPHNERFGCYDGSSGAEIHYRAAPRVPLSGRFQESANPKTGEGAKVFNIYERYVYSSLRVAYRYPENRLVIVNFSCRLISGWIFNAPSSPPFFSERRTTRRQPTTFGRLVSCWHFFGSLEISSRILLYAKIYARRKNFSQWKRNLMRLKYSRAS